MRILKRKTRYYLQHSFRVNKKVITKEVFLGNKIPDNLEEIKTNFESEILRGNYETFERIKKNYQTEWNKLSESVKERKKEEFSIIFTYNTNSIEGSTITMQETLGIIKEGISPKKPLREVKETEMHSKLFLGMLGLKKKVSEELILSWHKILFEQTKEDIAGKFRDYGVKVGDYKAVDWQDVNKLIKDLVEYINNSKEKVIELVARSHYRFEKIHPFGDGNGRIGRLLMNYLLWINDYPMLVIEKKKTSSYYKALKNDEDKFVKYFFKYYLKAHNEFK